MARTSRVSRAMGLLAAVLPFIRALIWATIAVTLILVGLPAVLAAAT